MQNKNDKKIILPGTIIEEAKFYELANKYLKKIIRKHTKDWGVDILELLLFLSNEKSPAISGGGIFHTDNESIGSTWIAGSLKAVRQKTQTDDAAYEIVNIVRKYREAEINGEEFFLEPLRKELDEALNKYDGITTNIYFLYDDKNNSIKVGRSVGVTKRIKNLQTGSSSKLKLIYQCPARTAWDKLIKTELSNYKIRNEWFVADKNVFKFILWLKYVQEHNLNPELFGRNKYDDEKLYQQELRKLLKKV